LSVYTTVGRAELAAWLAPLKVGELLEHAGIAAGMQNSNYFVTTARGRFVLTLFEAIDPAALDFYLRLQAHLADAGLPCPRPAVDAAGSLWRHLCGKPAALLSCLPGQAIETPDSSHCRAVGGALAQLHRAAAELGGAPVNPCGAAWRQQVGGRLLPLLPSDEAGLLADELAFQSQQDWSQLPQGVIHADLFRDNVLWQTDGCLGGLLDFYFAGVDAWLFDLAVVANDWCPDAGRLAALVEGYAGVRSLTDEERSAWPAVRRAAALRFWLLRLEAKLMPRAGEVVTVKDPGDFRRLLEKIRLAPEALPG
jgi:homoserine kinase type II